MIIVPLTRTTARRTLIPLVLLLGLWPSVTRGQTVTSLTLINTTTGAAVAGFDPIMNGATLNLMQLPATLDIRATVTGTVASVRFGLDTNPNFRIENGAPYELNGGTPWSPSTGPHTITATPFALAGATGTAGPTLTVAITVTLSAPATSHRLRIYQGTSVLTELDVPVAAAVCNQALSPATPVPVTNPVRWIWDDPLNVGRECRYPDDARFLALADGAYEAAVASVNASGVGPESPHVPFGRSRPQPPPAPTGVRVIP